MPRPAITMVFKRSSRSSKLLPTTGTSDTTMPEPPSSSTVSTAPSDSSDFNNTSSVSSSSEHSPEKRIRKPSQRMLEALQHEDESSASAERGIPSSRKDTKTRRENSSSNTPPKKKGRLSKGESAQVTEDSTPEIPLKSLEASLPGKSERKRGRRQEVDSHSTEGSLSATKKVEITSPSLTIRTISPRKRGKPSEVEVGEATGESDVVTEEEQSAEELTPKKLARLKIRLPRVDMVDQADEIDVNDLERRLTAESPPKTRLGAAKRNLSKDPSEEQAPCGKTLRRSKKATSELKDPVVSVEGSQQNVDTSINEPVMESEVATPEASTAPTERRLTARQRAKLYGAEERLIKLEDPEPKTPAANHLEKREERNKKRREQAAEKREVLKKETVQKLLHKSTSTRKSTKDDGLSNDAKKAVKYVIDEKGITMLCPAGFPSIPHMAPIAPPVVISCGVSGCTNVRKYCCSTTGVALCSLQCYRKNQALLAKDSYNG